MGFFSQNIRKYSNSLNIFENLDSSQNLQVISISVKIFVKFSLK